MNHIVWPEHYLPGFSDNFVSNEVIVTGVTLEEAWNLLATPALWPRYYANSADIRIHDDQGPVLADGVRFFFSTFGFPVESQVVECVPPAPGQAARIAWHGWTGEGDERLDVHHAWLLEALPGARLRILTQETQNGKPARALAADPSHPMINGHQSWLNGLVAAARAAKG